MSSYTTPPPHLPPPAPHKNQENLPDIREFTIIKPISRGAFGKVFLGYRNTSPEVLYAIKAMRKEDLFLKNSMDKVVKERDAQVLAAIDPFCVKLFYSLQTKNYIYLVMEYCIGGDLKSLANRMTFFPLAMAAFYIAEIAVALNYLHTNGVVHRDLKPDNLLLDKRGHIKLTDFGLSRVDLGSGLSPGTMKTIFTPGQIASLKDNLTFSKVQYEACVSINTSRRVPCNSTPRRLRIPLRQLRQTPPVSVVVMKPPSPPKVLTSTPSPPFVCLPLMTTPSPPMQKECLRQHFYQSAEWSIIHTPKGPREKRAKIEGDDSSFINLSFSSISTSPTESIKLLSDIFHSSPLHEKTQDDVVGLKLDFGDQSPVVRGGEEKNVVVNEKRFVSSPDVDFASQSDYQESFDQGSHHSRIPSASAFHSHNRPQLDSDIGFGTGIASTESATSDLALAHIQTREIEFCRSKKNDTNDQDSNHGQRSPEIGRLQHAQKTSLMHNSHFQGLQNIGRSSQNCRVSPPMMMGKIQEKHRFSINNNNNNYASVSSASFSGKRKRWDHSSFAGKSNLTQDMALFDINKSTSNIALPVLDRSLASSAALSISQDSSENSKILGTPDYLAPELIQKSGNGPPVDFWALGVCFYEFAIGCLPFNDESPSIIFGNIVNRSLEFPEDMDQPCQRCIEGLLEMDPEERFNLKTLKSSKCKDLFKDILWDNLYDMEAPFVPQPDSPTDVKYFAPRNEELKIEISSLSSP